MNGTDPEYPTDQDAGGLTKREYIMIEMMKVALLQGEDRSFKDHAIYAELAANALMERL